jgi:hypothetical protein
METPDASPLAELFAPAPRCHGHADLFVQAMAIPDWDEAMTTDPQVARMSNGRIAAELPPRTAARLLEPLAFEIREACVTAAERAAMLREMAVLVPEDRVYQFCLLAVLVAPGRRGDRSDLLGVVPALHVLEGRCGLPVRPREGEPFRDPEGVAPYVSGTRRLLAGCIVFRGAETMLDLADFDHLRFSPLACPGGGYEIAEVRSRRHEPLTVLRLASGEVMAAPTRADRPYLYRCLGVEVGGLSGYDLG